MGPLFLKAMSENPCGRGVGSAMICYKVCTISDKLLANSCFVASLAWILLFFSLFSLLMKLD